MQQLHIVGPVILIFRSSFFDYLSAISATFAISNCCDFLS